MAGVSAAAVALALGLCRLHVSAPCWLVQHQPADGCLACLCECTALWLLVCGLGGLRLCCWVGNTARACNGGHRLYAADWWPGCLHCWWWAELQAKLATKAYARQAQCVWSVRRRVGAACVRRVPTGMIMQSARMPCMGAGLTSCSWCGESGLPAWRLKTLPRRMLGCYVATCMGCYVATCIQAITRRH